MSIRTITLLLGLTLALATPGARADTLDVPGDFPTIQAALDAANVNDIINISGGIYAEAVSAAVPTNCIIQAKGNVRIDATGLGTAFDVSGTNIQINGIKVIGADADGFVIGGTNVIVSKCKAFDVGHHAFVLASTNLQLLKCQAVRPADDGFHIESGTNVELTSCKVIDASNRGIRVHDEANNVTVAKVRIVRPDGAGIVVDASSVTIEDSWGTGFAVAGNGAVAQDCVVVKAGGTGFEISGNAGTWTANRSTKAGGNGFDLVGMGNTLSLNKATGSGGFDLFESNPGSNTIEDDNIFGTVGP